MSKSNRNWRISQLKISINSGRWTVFRTLTLDHYFILIEVVLFCFVCPGEALKKKIEMNLSPHRYTQKTKKKSLIKLISNTDFWSASKMMIKYKEKLLFTPKVIYQAFRIYWKLYFLSSPWGIYSLTAI